MSDKKTERDRYDKKASRLLSKPKFDENAGSSEYSPQLRAPYLKYEDMHLKFINSDDHVLEIGAGTGTHTQSLLKSGAFVTATDISPNSVRVIKKRYKKYSERLTVKVADMEFLPFNDNSFNVVCSAGSMSYGDNEVVMNEINRVLKPGGRVIIVDSLHENPVYIANRYMGYLRGNRSLSTLKRMPTLRLIHKYRERFDVKELHFFGSLVWLSPLFSLLFGERLAAKIVDKFDTLINVRRSAFKFLAVFLKNEF